MKKRIAKKVRYKGKLYNLLGADNKEWLVSDVKDPTKITRIKKRESEFVGILENE